MPPLARDALEVLMVVALAGMLRSAVGRWRAGRIELPRCPGCGRLGSRAYVRCPRCGESL